MPRVITPAVLTLAVAALAACSDAPTAPRTARVAAPPGVRRSVVVYGFTDLGTLGGTSSAAHAVNAAGQVVGESKTYNDAAVHAFLWENGAMRDLGFAADQAVARAINARGQIVGDDIEGGAFLWENNSVRYLGSLGGGGTSAHGINGLGQVVGWSKDAQGRTHAYLWQNGDMQPLPGLGSGVDNAAFANAINDAGQVVGQSSVTANGDVEYHGVLWQNGAIYDLTPDGTYLSSASAINALGQVVGWYFDANIRAHGFVWQNGTRQDLAGLGEVYPTSINDFGQVVGSNAGGGAFLWQGGEAISLGVLGDEPAIDDNGDVVGTYVTPGTHEQHAVLVSVAIPATIDLVPGDATNTVKLSSKGAVTVNVLGSRYFDASRIDAGSLTLGDEDGNDTGITRSRSGAPQAVFKDSNRDGYVDLQAQFAVPAMKQRGDLTAATTRLVLLGARNDGKRIRGVDAVRVQ